MATKEADDAVLLPLLQVLSEIAARIEREQAKGAASKAA